MTGSTAIPRSGTRDRAKSLYGKIGQAIDEAIGLGEGLAGMVDQNGDGTGAAAQSAATDSLPRRIRRRRIAEWDTQTGHRPTCVDPNRRLTPSFNTALDRPGFIESQRGLRQTVVAAATQGRHAGAYDAGIPITRYQLSAGSAYDMTYSKRTSWSDITP